MNWWRATKLAVVEDFESRNRANRSIHRLSELSEFLAYASELVHMTNRGARRMVSQIRQNKTLSTYPEIEEVLRQADLVALDSPGKFAVYCKAAAEAIDGIVASLELQREQWMNEGASNTPKGIVDE